MPWQRPLLLALFCLSGFATLVHEVIWARMLYPVFGMSIVAISVVAATFMAGLGLGSQLFGPRVDRAEQPLRLYALFEIAIGALAFCVPTLVSAVPGVYAVFGRVGTPAALDEGLRLVVVAALLLPACLLMGGTFPAFVRGSVRGGARFGGDVALVYALNTVGGAAGCLAAGFVLSSLPLSTSVYAAASLNVAVGIAALLVGPRRATIEPGAPEAAPLPAETTPGTSAPPAAAVLGVLFLTGLLSLSYEILWTRALIQILLASYFSFSLILAAMLVGITLGSMLYRAALSEREPTSLLVTLSALLFVASAASFLGVFALVDLTDFARRLPVGDPGLHTTLTGFAICFLAFLPSSVVFGAMFPVSLQLYARARARLGADMGRAYAVNTVGSVIGILMTGLVLVDWLGSGGSLVLLLTLNLGVIALALAIRPAGTATRPGVAWGALGAAALALFLLYPREVFLAHQAEVTTRPWQGQARVLFQGEDDTSMATVTEIAGSPFRFARDGVVEEGTRRIIFHSNLLEVGGTRIYEWNVAGAYLTTLLHPSPERVLLIGYGSGRQLATLVGLPELERIDVVEISRVNIDASGHFYLDPQVSLADPRVRLFVEDGRNHLLKSRERYDLIVVDVGGLGGDGREFFYTREFLELCRARLREGGLLFTWLQVDRLLGPVGWSYQNTFRQVFPRVAIWYGARTPASFPFPWVMGAPEGFEIDYASLAARFERLNAAQRTELALTGIRTPEELLSLFAAGLDGKAPERIAASRLLTDDHPALWRAWERSGLDDLAGLDFVRDPGAWDASLGHLLDESALPPVRGLPARSRVGLVQARSALIQAARAGLSPVVRRALERSLAEGEIRPQELAAFAGADGDRALVRHEARTLLGQLAPRPTE